MPDAVCAFLGKRQAPQPRDQESFELTHYRCLLPGTRYSYSTMMTERLVDAGCEAVG